MTAFASPDWIGWGYRLIEAGGVLTAMAMLLPWPAGLGRPGPRWAAAVLLGAGPFIAYFASRTVGVPGDQHAAGAAAAPVVFLGQAQCWELTGARVKFRFRRAGAAPRRVSFGRYRTAAFDGCRSVRVPDTLRNRGWPGKTNAALGVTGYPVIQLMTLSETGHGS